MAEAIDQRAASALDQGRQLLKYPRAVLGVKTVGPALGVGEHVLRRAAHDRADVLADERAGEIAGGLGRVDDGGADREQMLKAQPRAAELGNVGPGADQFQGPSFVVSDNLEGVLNP